MSIKHIFIALAAVMVASGAYAGTTLTSKDYVDTAIAGKQTKIGAMSGDYVVMYPNSDNGEDDGEIGARAIIDSVEGYDEGNELVTVGGINNALIDKQDLIPAGTSGNLITYNGSAGSVGSASVYNSANQYSGQTGSLVQAQHVNSTAMNAFNAHLTCGQWASGQTQTPENCLLWSVNNLSGTYVPGSSQQQ